MSSNLVKYASYDSTAADEDQQFLEQLGGGRKEFLKLRTGRNKIRILPGAPGERRPWVVVANHFIKQTASGNPMGFNCPRTMKKERCPSCEKADLLEKSKSKVDQDQAFAYRPKVQAFASVIDRDNPEAGPQILRFGKLILSELIEARRDHGDFTDPHEGFDITIKRKGEGRQTEYKLDVDREDTPLGDMSWLDQRPDLLTYTKVPSYEEIVARARGEKRIETETELDEDDYARPAGNAPSGSARLPAAVDPDDGVETDFDDRAE